MRHQERNVSEFDEIITYPPSAAPSGEKQVMSCVQAFTAALGFAMSAGWDWLPSMHTLWLRDYIEAVSMPTPFGFFGTLSGSIFFKMVMLLALCPVMERLFLAFPLDRVAFRRKPFPNAGYALLPPALRERIYLSTPLILAQLCAILLLLVLTFSLPPCLDGLMPWLLGTVSALFGLIWFVLVTLLPGVWSGISYGLAITFSILISLLLDTAPAESLARFRMLFPILAIPLIFFAMPPSDDIRRRIRRHHRQRLFSTRVKGVLLRGLLLRRLSYLDILSKQGSVYLVLCVFPIMYGVHILLDFFNWLPDGVLQLDARTAVGATCLSHHVRRNFRGVSRFVIDRLLPEPLLAGPYARPVSVRMRLPADLGFPFSAAEFRSLLYHAVVFRLLRRVRLVCPAPILPEERFLVPHVIQGTFPADAVWFHGRVFAVEVCGQYPQQLSQFTCAVHAFADHRCHSRFVLRVLDPASVAALDGHDAEAVAGRGVCADHSGRSV